ncbi:Endonuclease/exonuclease/phosphatase [Pisolithus marmoratus]|nr:Endonuclease/exonuclease/phosphatase [Pisolithus marmoratus]
MKKVARRAPPPPPPSSDGFTPPKPKPPPRPGIQTFPRPPPRPSGVPYDASVASTHMSSGLPPLPSRRVTPDEVLEVQSPAPPLPARNSAHAASSMNVTDPVCERKLLGNSKLLPPPTRQIGLGDKLPPVRRPPTPSSDEESGEDEDPRTRTVDTLPDSSRSSRRPPSLSCFAYPASRIQVPAHSGQVAIASPSVVVATHHHIKCYDLTLDDIPLWTIDTREAGLRDAKVTCLEFKPTPSERYRYVWVGTKEGHLFEVDVSVGSVTATKYGRMMVTVDDAGKVMVFDPDSDVGMAGDMGEEDVSLVYTQSRVYRIAEKQDFVKMLGGLLWTSVRTEVNGTGAASVPVIRIYDPLVPGSVARCVMPTQRVGAVTCGTLLPSHPGHVYLGHEGGFISVWNVDTSDGTPECLEVMKVSTSDVLCLEGVNDRLWAGGRKGMVSAYDVGPRPWVVTNCWEAHDGLPVLKLFVDPSAIERVGKLCVVSVGRDERMRFWDGLLGSDRVDQELLKRERAFSKFRNLDVLIVSWNVDAAKPDALSSDAENAQFFQNVFQSTDGPDIIAFGFQEVIDLESRKMAAKTVLLGGKKKGEDGKISEKVTSSYKRWHDRLVSAVKMAMPSDSPYTVTHTESLVGLFTCIFVKNAHRVSVKDVAITTIKRGMGGRYGNKGAIVARLVVDDSSICFINCHLAAGQGHVRQRNADVTAMLEEKSLFPPSDAVEEYIAYVGGGDGSMVLDHEIVFLNGDMNYRIDQRREAVIHAIQSGELESLFIHDQLLKEMKHNRGFRLRAFQEGPLTFAPTYKYDRRSSEFDTSEKRRTPAWCDRILWRSRDPERVVQFNYQRYEANVSDHRPISAAFKVTIKSVRQDVRAREKVEVEKRWMEMEMVLLASAREFYLQRARTLI